ncbi:hypothetical protein GCM10010129_02860 [Streptomyces fumigatiscleroticus]|nr:hypothetical protein GCM10010129_02860 [Streptomyces fumigatiscleroticus]
MPDTASAGPGPHEILARYHRAMLDMSAKALADLYAADTVHAFLFLFPGMAGRYRGREEIRAGYRAVWGGSPARPESIEDVVVHDSTDPEVITVEQTVTGTLATAGRPFRFPGRVHDRAVADPEHQQRVMRP